VLPGAVAIAFSGILFRLAHVSPTTGAFYRCVWALPLLWLVARFEQRRWGPRPLRSRVFAWIAGVLFAADLVLWHNAIEQVGAGLATVLGNTQVVLVGLIAWVLLRERPSNKSLVAIPVVTAGIVLISGVVESDAYGSNPPLGRDLRGPDGNRLLGVPAHAPAGRTGRGGTGRAALRRDLDSCDRLHGDRPRRRRPRLYA